MVQIMYDENIPILWRYMSIINITSEPESAIQNNNNAVCYHVVHASVAIGMAIRILQTY